MGELLQDDISAPQSKHVEGTIRGLWATCPLGPRYCLDLQQSKTSEQSTDNRCEWLSHAVDI